MLLRLSLLNFVSNLDPVKIKMYKVLNLFHIAILLGTIALYTWSALSTDEFVDMYLPTICYRVQIHGYT